MKIKQPNDSWAGRSRYRQRGALLLIFTLFTISSTLLWLVPLPDISTVALSGQKKTALALRRAKAALIAYAVSYQERHSGRFGVLPCPDTKAGGLLGEGVAHGSCRSRHAAALGRLPWRTLGIPPLRDAHGECLWYAVSGAVKSNPAAWLLNADSRGSFVIQSADHRSTSAETDPAHRAVAVVLAPGAALPGQQRATAAGSDICGGHDGAADYLERAGPAIDHRRVATGADRIDHWLDSSTTRADFNDRIIYISAAELADAVYQRSDMAKHLSAPTTDSLAHAAALCLSRYNRHHSAPGKNSLPWPAPVILEDRRDNKAYDDQDAPSGRLFGRLPDRVDDSNRVLSVADHHLIQDCPYFSDKQMLWLWRNWKDHLFYAVADAYAPASAVADCTVKRNCLTLSRLNRPDDDTAYAAVLWFAGSVLPGQDRDIHAGVSDYLEGNPPAVQEETTGSAAVYDSRPQGPDFNDVMYCLLPTGPDDDQSTLDVIPCPH